MASRTRVEKESSGARTTKRFILDASFLRLCWASTSSLIFAPANEGNSYDLTKSVFWVADAASHAYEFNSIAKYAH